MKDVKIFYFSACGADEGRNLLQLVETGVSTTLYEIKGLENMILPYLNQGYVITHFSANSHSSVGIVLEKD